MDLGDILGLDGIPIDDAEKDVIVAEYERLNPQMSLAKFASDWLGTNCSVRCTAVDSVPVQVEAEGSPPGIEMSAVGTSGDDSVDALLGLCDDLRTSATQLDSSSNGAMASAEVDQYIVTATQHSFASLYSGTASAVGSSERRPVADPVAVSAFGTQPSYLDTLMDATKSSTDAHDAVRALCAFVPMQDLPAHAFATSDAMYSFTTELHATIQGMSSSDAVAARRAALGSTPAFLDDNVVRFMHSLPASDPTRAEFVSAMSKTADALTRDAPGLCAMVAARPIIAGPTVFISKMDRAFDAYIDKNLKIALKPYTPQSIYEISGDAFWTINNNIIDASRGKNIGEWMLNMRALGAVSIAMTRSAILAMHRNSRGQYYAFLAERFKELHDDNLETVGHAQMGVSIPGSDSLLTETTLAGKLQKGFVIIMNSARKQKSIGELQKSARLDTLAFMNEYTKRHGSAVIDSKFIKDTASLFFAAMAGFHLMHRLYHFTKGHPDMRGIRNGYFAPENAITQRLLEETS